MPAVLILTVVAVLLAAFVIAYARGVAAEVETAWLAAQSSKGPQDLPRTPAQRFAEQAGPVACQLMFVEQRAGRVVVDALLLANIRLGGQQTPAGSPVMLRATIPAQQLVGAAVVTQLSDWARDMAVVGLAVESGRARLCSGNTVVILDLDQAVGIR